MKNIFKNWKTTSAGITAIVTGIIGIIYAIKANSLTQEILTGSLLGIIGGIGLIFAKDGGVTGVAPK